MSVLLGKLLIFSFNSWQQSKLVHSHIKSNGIFNTAGGFTFGNAECWIMCINACVSVKSPVHLPIMPLTVPKSTEPWVGVELSPRFCSTSEPWQKTLTNSPRWKTPTSCRCCRSSSVVAALTARTAKEKYKERGSDYKHQVMERGMQRGRDGIREKEERPHQSVNAKKEKDVEGKVKMFASVRHRLRKRKKYQERWKRSESDREVMEKRVRESGEPNTKRDVMQK